MLVSGVGGSRTRVQTSSQRAFYMFIFPLIFELCQRESAQTTILTSKFRPDVEVPPKLFRNCVRPVIRTGTGLVHSQNVSSRRSGPR